MKIKPGYCKYILHYYFAATILVVISLFLPDTILNDILGLLGPNSVRLTYDAMEATRDVFSVFWFQGYSLVVAIAYFITLIVATNYTPFGVIIGADALVVLVWSVLRFLDGSVGQGLFCLADGLLGLGLSVVCIIASHRGKTTLYGKF